MHCTASLQKTAESCGYCLCSLESQHVMLCPLLCSLLTCEWHALQVDIVDAEELEDCSSLIRSINADATILPTQHSSVDVASLLHQGIYIQDTASADSSPAKQDLDAPSKWSRAGITMSASRQAESHGPSLDHSANALHSSSAHKSTQHAHKLPQYSGDHSHTSRVSTMAIRPSGPVPLQRSARASARQCSTWQPYTLPACGFGSRFT